MLRYLVRQKKALSKGGGGEIKPQMIFNVEICKQMLKALGGGLAFSYLRIVSCLPWMRLETIVNVLNLK